VLGLPLADAVEESGAAGMAAAPQVIVVGRFAMLPGEAALHVHQPRVPVAELRLALWPPMRPYSDLVVPEPIRCAMAVRQRLPGWRKRIRANAGGERRDAPCGQQSPA